MPFNLNSSDLKEFLDTKVEQYNNPKFIESDPIQIPHQFNLKEDIEIAGFLTATIAWGNRKSIITNAKRMMQLLDNSPYDFVINHQETDIEPLLPFVYRTFNGEDFIQFIQSLKHIYTHYKGLESEFSKYTEKATIQKIIHYLKTIF